MWALQINLPDRARMSASFRERRRLSRGRKYCPPPRGPRLEDKGQALAVKCHVSVTRRQFRRRGEVGLGVK